METAILKIKSLFIVLIFTIILVPVYTWAAVYPMPRPGDDIVGDTFVIQIQHGDTINRLCARYEISYHELVEANPHINFSRYIRTGDTLIIPKQHILPPYRKGIVINMSELRVYYFTPDGKYVFTFPVGMGRPDWRTPTTLTKVVKKEVDPFWFVPESIQAYTWDKYQIWLPDIMPPGPKNPLGKYAIYLAKNGYLIHGTNQPETVGTFASSGCMRLNSDAIQMLYEDVEIGTPVYIIHHPNKAGWLDGKLYLESHVPVKLNEKPSLFNDMDVTNAISAALRIKPIININWDTVHKIALEHDGVPHIIGE